MVSLVHGSEEVGAIFRNLIETGFFDGLFPDENKSTQKAENCKEVKTKGLCSTGPEGWHYVNDECTKYDGCDMMMEDSGKLYESENDCMMECSEKEAEEM